MQSSLKIKNIVFHNTFMVSNDNIRSHVDIHTSGFILFHHKSHRSQTREVTQRVWGSKMGRNGCRSTASHACIYSARCNCRSITVYG